MAISIMSVKAIISKIIGWTAIMIKTVMIAANSVNRIVWRYFQAALGWIETWL